MVKFNWIFLLLLTFVFAGFGKAQVQTTNPAPLPPKRMQCTLELFDKAENAYRRRVFDNDNGYGAEMYINKILEVCPNASLLFELQKRIEILNEERAEHNLTIAIHYLKQFRSKKGGLKGSQSRLRLIIEEYPKYSKINEATFLLAETYFLEENFEDAEKWYQNVIKEFPESEFSDKAFLKIELINRTK